MSRDWRLRLEDILAAAERAIPSSPTLPGLLA